MRKLSALGIVVILLLLCSCPGTVTPPDPTPTPEATPSATPTPASALSVSYDGNGNSGGTVPASSAGHSSGDVIAVSVNSGNLVKSGYAFAGWNTKADGTGTRQYERSSLTLGGQDVVLYARWVPAAAGELIANGDFALGGLNWGFAAERGGTGSVDISSAKASVSVVDSGSDVGAVQLCSESLIGVEAGQCYRLSFDLMGPAGRSMVAELSEAGVDVDHDGYAYTTCMWMKVDTTGSSMTVSRDYIATAPLASLRFCLRFGNGDGTGSNSGASFEVSNASLKKTPTQPTPETENMVLNGNFSYRNLNWNFWADRSAGAAGTADFDGTDFDVAVADGGIQVWQANLTSAEWYSLNANQTYAFSYECQGQAGHYMSAIIQEQGNDDDGDGNGYTTYASTRPVFDGTSQKISYSFKPAHANRKVKVIFQFGNEVDGQNDGTQVKIRNVRLRNLSAPSTMTVYVAGTCLDSGNVGHAGYWKNGTWTPLPGLGAGLESTASSICVSGSDIYVGGACADSGGVLLPGYWKNGTWTPLAPASAGRDSNVYCIQASGGKLYAVGFGQNASDVQVPLCWEDGSLSVLPVLAAGHDAGAAKLAFMGNEVIVMGFADNAGDVTVPVYWRNGSLNTLPVLDAARASQPLGVAVNGADLYFCGYSQDSGGVYVPGFWMNGTWTGLVPPVAGNAGAVNIGFSGGERIIVGAYGGAIAVSGAWRGAVWEGYGSPSGMTSDTIHDSGMFIIGSDVYGGTNRYSGSGRYETGYYVNGCWVECPAPDNSRANWAYCVAVTSP